MDVYFDHYQKVVKPDDLYPKMIALALKSDMEIMKHLAGFEVDLNNVLSNAKSAYQIARNKLQDYRAQAWTVGLCGKCQILLNKGDGGEKLRKAMRMRKSSGENTKVYRKWLHRISKYPLLLPHTKNLLEKEMVRTGM